MIRFQRRYEEAKSQNWTMIILRKEKGERARERERKERKKKKKQA